MEHALRDIFSRKMYSRFEKGREDFKRGLKSGIWIYGAGNFGRNMAVSLSQKGYGKKIEGFIDANKAGQAIDGRKVISPKEFERLAKAAGEKPAVLIGVLSPGNDTGAIAVSLRRCARVYQPIAAFALLWGRSRKNYFYLADPAALARARKDIQRAYKLLGDAKSRRLYLAHLACRFTGDMSVMPGPSADQYFPAGLGLAAKMNCFFDVGAYTGDTLEYIAAKGIKFGKYKAFEPDPVNFKRLKAQAGASGLKNVRVFPYALGRKACETGLAADGSGSRLVKGSKTRVQCKTCDQFIDQAPTYLKMDVEGFEKDVLAGAGKTIAKVRPALAVCVYHKPADIWELPLYLRSLGYKKQYLRLHAYNGLDLVLYAF